MPRISEPPSREGAPGVVEDMTNIPPGGGNSTLVLISFSHRASHS